MPRRIHPIGSRVGAALILKNLPTEIRLQTYQISLKSPWSYPLYFGENEIIIQILFPEANMFNSCGLFAIGIVVVRNLRHLSL